MSHTKAAALRTTYWVFQIGSKLARSACGTKRSARVAARCEIAGVASPPMAVTAPARLRDFRNALRSMDLTLWYPVIGLALLPRANSLGHSLSEFIPAIVGRIAEHCSARR